MTPVQFKKQMGNGKKRGKQRNRVFAIEHQVMVTRRDWGGRRRNEGRGFRGALVITSIGVIHGSVGHSVVHLK